MNAPSAGQLVAPVVGLLVAFAVGAACGLHPLLARPLGRMAVGAGAGPLERSESLDVVDVAERIARDVRSGASLRSAVEHAAGTAPGLLGEVADALVRQAPLRDALSAHRPTHDERDLLVHALTLGAAHPEVASQVLDRTATVVRERRAWRLERRAQAAQARASARVLTLLPLAFAGWGALSSDSVRDAYASSPATTAVALVGVVLNLVGWLWMRHVVGGGGR